MRENVALRRAAGSVLERTVALGGFGWRCSTREWYQSGRSHRRSWYGHGRETIRAPVAPGMPLVRSVSVFARKPRMDGPISHVSGRDMRPKLHKREHEGTNRMTDNGFRAAVDGVRPGRGLPETPHELPIDRTRVDALLDRVRTGERIDIHEEFLNCVDWRGAFARDDGRPLDTEEMVKLVAFYREKFSDIGTVYLAELLSTEFMTEQRAQGDIVFSDRLLEIGRNEPELWKEIRLFFRRKEFATAMLVHADHGGTE